MAEATATSTVNATPNGVDNTQRHQVLTGKIALSAGGTYATNGIPLPFAFLNAEGGAFIPNFATPVPTWIEIQSLAGLVGQTYLYDPVHGTLRIAVAGVELANNAAIPVDTIGFRAEFNRGE
jgi:hypothetical protein